MKEKIKNLIGAKVICIEWTPGDDPRPYRTLFKKDDKYILVQYLEKITIYDVDEKTAIKFALRMNPDEFNKVFSASDMVKHI